MLRKGKEMTISFSAFLSQLVSNPALAVTVLLTLGVILVNGWTDAPKPSQPVFPPEPSVLKKP